jgi:hypothetical protein
METNKIYKINTNITTGTNVKLSFSIAAKDLADCFYNVSGMTYNGEKIDSHIDSIVATNVTVIIPSWSNRELNPNYKNNETEEE